MQTFSRRLTQSAFKGCEVYFVSINICASVDTAFSEIMRTFSLGLDISTIYQKIKSVTFVIYYDI